MELFRFSTPTQARRRFLDKNRDRIEGVRMTVQNNIDFAGGKDFSIKAVEVPADIRDVIVAEMRTAGWSHQMEGTEFAKFAPRTDSEAADAALKTAVRAFAEAALTRDRLKTVAAALRVSSNAVREINSDQATIFESGSALMGELVEVFASISEKTE